MARYRTINNDVSINVDGQLLAAGTDGTFTVTAGSRAEAVLLASGALPANQLNAAEIDGVRAVVSGAGKNSANGLYLGAAFPKKLRGGTWGRKVASWANALQNSAGTTSFVTGDLPPWVDNATRVLRLDQNAAISFGQQSPVDGANAYMPKMRGPGFTAGLWVKNPNARTMPFELRMFNAAANRNTFWNGTIQPGGWTFITFSPSQALASGLVDGTDAVNYIRVSQIDSRAEGAWRSGEYLLFGNVYVDVVARPKFCLTFDDGYLSQRYPINTPKVSGPAYVSSTNSNTLTTASTHNLVVGEPLIFGETAPTSLTAGTTYYVSTSATPNFTLATDQLLTTPATTTGFAGTARYQYGGSQARSVQELVESYGFRGSLFIVPSWLGTTGRYGYGGGSNAFLSAADVQAMWADGWAIGSHSQTHPSNGDNAGLRLLGPYGYFLSNTFDNLPAQYLTNWSIDATFRRRVTTGTQASPSVFSTENAHKFLVNQPIVYTDVAPTGCTLGVTYYVQTIPTVTTYTLATDQGTLAVGVNNTTGAWSGTANYRWPGSSNDDTAIYADIVTAANALLALGITTGFTFFALPQGAADTYVRSACIRGGFKWVRGISPANSIVHSIPVGAPSGDRLYNVDSPAGGWMLQPDSIQTDGLLALSTITGYVDDTITQGACGCNYHHDFSIATLAALDRLCQYLKMKSDAKLIDVLTLDELAKELGIF